ncbi:L-type lectin-domain containing receptor kinase SIT2-like [Phoenix dactylifera]|uniref:non-specific serine/threonine protein kinase n=1 Tax=Phoenix dactylifera TaxID=42345 RepID=A0A8B7BUC0_PHODC|nr:L-type lectin-domain containing receptor kinase SIT2-like [Phoenix dactylifera]
MVSRILLVILLLKLVASFDNEFIFHGFTDANLSLNGLAQITSSGLLMLTNNTKAGLGHAFHPELLHFKNSSNGEPLSFSTTFVFAMIPEYPDVCGHGLAFAVSPSKEFAGAMPSQHLGLFNTTDNGNSSNHIFAIELDTVMTVDFHDINDNHVGIDINNLISVNSSPVSYFDGKSGGSKSLKLISGDLMQVWIEYDGMDMQLDVTISPIDAPKPASPLLSSKVDLSSVFLDDMYVGFSASTGAATSHHYILGWSFSLNGDAQPLNLSKLPSLPYQESAKKKSHLLLTIALPLAAAGFLLIPIAAIFFVLRRRRKKYGEILEDWEHEYGPHRFSYKDLFKATKGFKEENLLGFGGFGRVYKGVLPSSSTQVAVKKISHESWQGMREFVAEIASMGRLRHRNLVQLLGYCRREGELLLVYEYMPNSSLDNFLFQGKQPALTWSQRFQIIKDVSSGLHYLHEGWEQVVIHRDIKASNVLIDAEFNGKLGDFGLARLHTRGTNPQTTHIVGTLGYLAPEISKTGKATTSSDVYAFGAFLLEVACGRRPIECHPSVEVPGLVEWVLGCWKTGTILEARDPVLGDEYVVKEMELVLTLGLLCSHPDPMARPSMRQVVQFLEGDAPLPPMSADALITSTSAQGYDECFDDFVISDLSTTDRTDRTFSSPFVPGGR